MNFPSLEDRKHRGLSETVETQIKIWKKLFIICHRLQLCIAYHCLLSKTHTA